MWDFAASNSTRHRFTRWMREGRPARDFLPPLQADLQELPHPHRQVEGGNVARQQRGRQRVLWQQWRSHPRAGMTRRSFSARFIRLIAGRGHPCRPPCNPPGPSLDQFVPSPGTTLLTVEEAKDRLREIVEGFFFRRRRTTTHKRRGRRDLCGRRRPAGQRRAALGILSRRPDHGPERCCITRPGPNPIKRPAAFFPGG
jgi:hypothetical protein